MKVTPVTATLSVASQPSEAEIAGLGESGVALLINNRPDDEETEQPGTLREAAAAEKAGVGYLHLPVTGGSITRGEVERFRAAVEAAGGPVVAHCRSGTRSLTLWAIGEVLAGNQARDDLLEYGSRNGFDLTGALRWLERNDLP